MRYYEGPGFINYFIWSAVAHGGYVHTYIIALGCRFYGSVHTFFGLHDLEGGSGELFSFPELCFELGGADTACRGL